VIGPSRNDDLISFFQPVKKSRDFVIGVVSELLNGRSSTFHHHTSKGFRKPFELVTFSWHVCSTRDIWATPLKGSRPLSRFESF